MTSPTAVSIDATTLETAAPAALMTLMTSSRRLVIVLSKKGIADSATCTIESIAPSTASMMSPKVGASTGAARGVSAPYCTLFFSARSTPTARSIFEPCCLSDISDSAWSATDWASARLFSWAVRIFASPMSTAAVTARETSQAASASFRKTSSLSMASAVYCSACRLTQYFQWHKESALSHSHEGPAASQDARLSNGCHNSPLISSTEVSPHWLPSPPG